MRAMTVMQPNQDAIKQHLEFLFGDVREYDDGWIEVAYTDDKGKPNHAKLFAPGDVESCLGFITDTNKRPGTNVYLGASLRDPEAPQSKRGSLQQYYASGVLWADLDDEEAVENAKERYKDLPPTFVIVTGRKPHRRAQLWWKLTEPATNPEKLKQALQALAQNLNADSSVADPARIMRAGGTIAWPHKKGRVKEVTEVIQVPNGKPVSIEQVLAAYPLKEEKAETNGHKTDLPTNPISGTYKIQGLLENTKEPGQWNKNMCTAVASMVGSGWTDAQIKIATQPYKWDEYDQRVHDSEIGMYINTARKKYGVPQPEETGPIRQTTQPRVQPLIKKEELYYVKESDITLPEKANTLINNLLGRGELSVVYGESNCGKTFFGSDLAFSVALGHHWRDNRVLKGGVIYTALESALSLKKRVIAYKKYNKVTKAFPFFMVPCQVDFMDPEGNINEYIDLIKRVQDEEGTGELVIVDTLARALAGGDENSGQDMGMLVYHADRIRAETDAHVMFIHHSGKDKARGARGHSSLRAAVDTEIEITRDHDLNLSTITVVKQRDMELIPPLHFQLEVVTLGVNEYDEAITSCVCLPANKEDLVTEHRKTNLSDVQQIVLDALKNTIITHGQVRNSENLPNEKMVSYDQWRDELVRFGFYEDISPEKAKYQFRDCRNALKKKGLIGFRSQFAWLT